MEASSSVDAATDAMAGDSSMVGLQLGAALSSEVAEPRARDTPRTQQTSKSLLKVVTVLWQLTVAWLS